MYPYKLSIAPMLDLTDRHYRYFMRLLGEKTLLYTEMVVSTAILKGPRERLLAFSPEEHPIALQLGGSCPTELSQVVKIASEYKYDEINLNVGCPSPRVQKGRFGACLMKEPELVADCVASMKTASTIPVTVKTRLGVDEEDSYEFLVRFIETVSKAGCDTFILHARKAWLKGLSPKENRSIPPLCYDRVEWLKRDFPSLNIILNGGVSTVSQIQSALEKFDGVMIGRAAYQDPYFMAQAHAAVENSAQPLLTRREILQAFLPYMEKQLSENTPLHAMTRHILGLYQGIAGARTWRRLLGAESLKASAGITFVEQLIQEMEN